MRANNTRKLTCSDKGYHGKPVEGLTREELLEVFLDLSQRVYECSSTNNQCKAFLSFDYCQGEGSDA